MASAKDGKLKIVACRSVTRRNGLSIPIEIRPHVGTALAAGLAHKAWFDIGQPHVIGLVGTACAQR
jgi:hypothetical protein